MFNRACYAVMLEMLHDNQCWEYQICVSTIDHNFSSMFRLQEIFMCFQVLPAFFVELHNLLHISFIFVSSLIFDIYRSFFIQERKDF